MKTRRLVILAAVVLFAGVPFLFVSFALRGEHETVVPRPAELALENGPAVEGFESGEAISPSGAPQLWVLELGKAPSGPSGPHAAGQGDEERAGQAASAGLPSLAQGSGSITFVLRDTSGRPLPGVSVLLSSVRSKDSFQEAVAGARGEARFAGLAAGRYSYRIRAADRPQLASTAPIGLQEGERKHLTLRLGGTNLAISGRVLNQDGEPVPGIELSAMRFRFSSLAEEPVVHADARGLRGRTNEDGSYAIQGLEEGEYKVETKATDRYGSLKAMFQAGTDSADLVLPERLRVYGTVTDPSGEPLGSVRVEPIGQSELSTLTAEDGSYQVFLAVVDQQDYTFRFRLRGYEEERLKLASPRLEEARKQRRLDVELEPARNRSVVSGTVRTRRGEPVPRQTVSLRSQLLNTEYWAPSDRSGNFSIPDVQIGSDYRLSVRPERAYRDYSQGPIAVTADAVSLDIVLEPLASGRLSGRMIDAEGNPVPRFRLWLVSLEAQRNSLAVSSDEAGYFLVEDAPEGAVRFDTRAQPRLRVSGIRVPERGERQVSLVLDWGDHVMHGSVVDDRGSPVAGAEVTISWSHERAGTQSHSMRKTASDGNGQFRFTQLGPGVHKIEVEASGYHPVQERYDVGRYSPDLEVRLEPVSR